MVEAIYMHIVNRFIDLGILPRTLK